MSGGAVSLTLDEGWCVVMLLALSAAANEPRYALIQPRFHTLRDAVLEGLEDLGVTMPEALRRGQMVILAQPGPPEEHYDLAGKN